MQNGTSLFAITTKSVAVFSASVFRSSMLDGEKICRGGDQIVSFFNRNGIYLFCSHAVLQLAGTSQPLSLDKDDIALPSATASAVADVKVSLKMQFHGSMQQFKQMFDDVCNSAKFPNVHLCSWNTEEYDSVITRQNMKIKKFRNCFFDLHQVKESLFNIVTSSAKVFHNNLNRITNEIFHLCLSMDK